MKVVILFGLLVTVHGMEGEKVFVTFRRLDKDQDAILTLNDLRIVFDSFDMNDDGFLGYEEFTKALYPELSKVAFHFFDTLDGNQDSKISRRVAMVILSRLDRDTDGKVPFTEFTLTFPMFKGELIEAVEFFTD